ncbi:GBF-interacting protein 1-like [Gastrolobium bilobum]|uniref:GBF-interacting protein 1-like n=1 Tax=Gastrolobium bilobum TaxID=150636 RepID=UPI002AB2AA55|nr:GBF-interacting protein 1-like [Gastrolobium bilobum]
MSSDGVSRVPIPNNVRKTIQDIREITGKLHTDDEIYTVLRECSMDPNETAQKLLYLDTFHEVKRRRDRKKEGLSNRGIEDSRLKQGGHGRGRRGASAGYSSNFSDGGGGRNLASHRENVVNHIAERGREPSTQPVSEKTKNNSTSQASRVSAVAANGPVNHSNGSSRHGLADQSLVGSGTSVSESSPAVNGANNIENVQPQDVVASPSSPIQTCGSATSIDQGKSLSSSDQLPSSSVSVVYSSSSDPVLAPPISQNHGVCGAMNQEVGNQCISAELNHVKGNKIVLPETVDLPSSKNEKSSSVDATSKHKALNKSNEVEKNQLSENSRFSPSLSCNDSLRSTSSCDNQSPLVTALEASEACVPSSAELRQHVTFPNHFQVPKALKTGLTFGSFDSFGPRDSSSSGAGGDNYTAALESSPGSDETATSSNQSASLSAQGDHVEYPQSTSYLIEKTPALENSTIVSDSKSAQPKQEVLLAQEAPPIPNVQSAQNYDLNFMSNMLGSQQVQFEGSQAQETSRLPNFVNASSQTVSSPSSTPPLQSSIPVSPQSVSIFRPPYPPNFFPYGHYYPPIYVSPMHQFLSHNGFPQQPSVGNMYLPAAAAAGIKFLPQFKAGANAGNMAHLGIPSGPFITPPVGYAPSPTVNTGSTSGNDDLAVSQLKENQIYTTGQLSEGSAVWVPAPGQDISSLQVSSLYNLTPHGHLAFPPTQNIHGAFAGIYHQPGQTVASPSTLLQQSQAVAGAVETVGPPSGAYQQPQHAQVNWNSNF